MSNHSLKVVEKNYICMKSSCPFASFNTKEEAIDCCKEAMTYNRASVFYVVKKTVKISPKQPEVDILFIDD